MFSSHVIDNPDVESEKALIRGYAPSIDEQLLHALTAAFCDLRELSAQGVLSYPYSTRELVAVTKVRSCHSVVHVNATCVHECTCEGTIEDPPVVSAS